MLDCRQLGVVVIAMLAGCATGSALGDNRQNLERLALGMTSDQVEQVMGPEGPRQEATSARRTSGLVRSRSKDRVPNPYRTEAHTAGQHTFMVLFYYTETKRRDGSVTDDELTPVILKDGLVDGVGWSHWNSLVEKHGFSDR